MFNSEQSLSILSIPDLADRLHKNDVRAYSRGNKEIFEGDTMATKSVTSTSQLPISMDLQELAPFLEEAKVYRVQNDSNASQPQFLVELPLFTQRGGEEKYLASNYFWGDGKNFYQLRRSGGATTQIGGGILSGHVTLDRPGHETMDLIYAGSQAQVVECSRADIEALEAVSADMLASANFFALPVKDEPQYLAKLPDGRSLLVTAPAPEFSYDFRVFLGSAGNMAEVEVNSVDRFRDGGTTDIYTAAGLFHFSISREPSTFTPSGSDTVIPLTKLDPSQNGTAIADLGVSLREYIVDSQRFICDE